MKTVELTARLLVGILELEKSIRAFEPDRTNYRADGDELRGRIELSEIDEYGVPWQIHRILGDDVATRNVRDAAGRLIRKLAVQGLVMPHWFTETSQRLANVQLTDAGRKIAIAMNK